MKLLFVLLLLLTGCSDAPPKPRYRIDRIDSTGRVVQSWESLSYVRTNDSHGMFQDAATGGQVCVPLHLIVVTEIKH